MKKEVLIISALLLALALILNVQATEIVHQENFSGTFNRTLFNDTYGIILNGSYTNGSYTSPIISTNALASWNWISWISGSRYGEALPDNGVSDDVSMAGIQLLYHMDETTGSLIDASGNGLNATPSGSPTYQAQSIFNKGIDFDGTNDYFDVPLFYAERDSLSNFTVCLWFNTTFNTGSWNRNWAFIDFDRSEYFGFFINADDGKLGFSTTSGSGGTKDMDGTTVANDGVWHFGCAVYNASETYEKKIYLDGTLDAERNDYATNQKLGTGTTRYGIIGDGSEASTFGGNRNNIYYEGQMDELAYWTRALSSEDISKLYERGTANMSIAFRSCNIANCSDASLGVISRGDTNLAHLASGLYAQYQINLSRTTVLANPKVTTLTINYSEDIVREIYSLTTEQNNIPESFFTNSSTVHIIANGTFESTPLLSITDSSGNEQISAVSMTANSDTYYYDYQLDGSNGWYDITINTNQYSSMFYQSTTWQDTYTDAEGQAYAFIRSLNVTEPGVAKRWLEPVDIDMNFTYLPDTSSLRVLWNNGTHYLEIPSQVVPINTTQDGMQRGRIIFLTSLNISEKKEFLIASSKATISTSYEDLINIDQGTDITISQQDYSILFSGTSGMLEDIYSLWGSNMSLAFGTTLDRYPEFQVGNNFFTPSDSTATSINITDGSLMGELSVATTASGASSKPFSMNCTAYAHANYIICTKNLTTTTTEDWKNLYLQGIDIRDGFSQNASVYNSSNITTTTAINSGNNPDTQDIDPDTQWALLYHNGSGNAIGQIYLNRTITTSYDRSFEVIDDGSNDGYHEIAIGNSNTEISAGTSFISRTAIIIPNGLSSSDDMEHWYLLLQSPVTTELGTETTADATSPTLTISGNISSTDETEVKFFSYWTDDSYFDYASINITGRGTDGNKTVLYSNMSYTLLNNGSFTNETWINITLSNTTVHQGLINATITAYDVAGRSTQTTITCTINDTEAPVITNISYIPNETDDIDPGTNITISANITEFGSLDNVTLYYNFINSSENSTQQCNMQAESTNLFTTTYNCTLNNLNDGNYSYYITANDTDGNIVTSTNTSITVIYDLSWTLDRSGLLTYNSSLYETNVSLGNITINNTGDSAQNYTCTAGAYNSRVYFNDSAGQTTFSIGAMSTVSIPLSATTRSVGQPAGYDDVTIRVTASDSGDEKQANFSIGTSEGGPLLFIELDYNSSIERGNSEWLNFIITNTGNESALDPIFNITLPDGWSAASSYTLSFSKDTLVVDAVEEGVFTNVTIPTSADTGTKTISLYAETSDGKNWTKTFEVAVSGQDVVVVQSSSGSGGGVSSSGGGGGASFVASNEHRERLFQTDETYELVRGDNETFLLVIENPFTGSLVNLSLNITGFLSSYLSWNYTNEIEIIPNASIKIPIHIDAPDYFTEGTHELIIEIAGVIQEETGSGNYTKTILTNLKEERKTTLMIHEISLLQATNYISSTNEKIAELSAFSSTAKSSRLLTQMQTALEQKHYGDIRTLHETITKEYQAGRNAKRLLEQVKQDIAQAAYQGLDTPQSERLAKLANVALARGAYDIAQKHAEDAKTTVVLETSGKFNLFAYIVNHWLTFSLLVIFSSIITYVFFILVKYGLIKGRLLMLNKEQDIILALIKQLQLECFRDGAISMERYNLSLEQYEKKLGKLVHKIIHIETMKTYFFLFYVSKYQRLCREKARLLTMIKKTQKDYLLRQELETQDYERRIKIYSERLTEIEETIVELRAHRHMHHSVTWTQQFKNKKRKLDHE